MAYYRVQFTKSARKEFERLAEKTRTKIVEALSLLSQNPYSELLNVKKLKGTENVFRFRIGDYRVLYEVENDQLIVLVIKVGHRREVYRR